MDLCGRLFLVLFAFGQAGMLALTGSVKTLRAMMFAGPELPARFGHALLASLLTFGELFLLFIFISNSKYWWLLR